MIRALEEIAYVAGELIAVREAGFTAEALKYPRSPDAMKVFCAWIGVPVEKAKRGWHYAPNKGMLEAWERVVTALKEPTSSDFGPGRMA